MSESLAFRSGKNPQELARHRGARHGGVTPLKDDWVVKAFVVDHYHRTCGCTGVLDPDSVNLADKTTERIRLLA